MVGESSVGKSTIVRQFILGKFEDSREPTIGAAVFKKTISLDDSDTSIKLEIWDTAGQERYQYLMPMYYRGARAVMIVYDMTDKYTFERAKTWVKEAREKAPREIQGRDSTHFLYCPPRRWDN